MPRRALRSLLLACLLLVLSAVPAAAVTDLGQFCFLFVGFTDHIRLAATLPAGDALIADIHFRWRGPGYQVLGSGSATPNLDEPDTKVDIALMGTHATGQFGGNKQCSLYFILTLATGGGPFELTCTGSGGAPFTASGQLQTMPCIDP